MFRYLLLFAAVCGYLQLLERPAEARRGGGILGAAVRGASRAVARNNRRSAAASRSQTPPPAPSVPAAATPTAPEDTPQVPSMAPGTLNVGPLSDNIAIMRRFQTVQPASDAAEARPAPLPVKPRATENEPLMPAYSEPPTTSALFVSMPASREPSWIRQQRLNAMLLPQPVPQSASRSTSGVATPNGIAGKCVAVRDGNHIVLRRSGRDVAVELAAVEPAGRSSKAALSKLVLGSP